MSFSLNEGLYNAQLRQRRNPKRFTKVGKATGRIIDAAEDVNNKLIRTTRLSSDAKKFIKHGEEAYKNGPWDSDDNNAMYIHGGIAGSMLTGTIKSTPKCDTCGKLVIPTGIDVDRSTIWGHMPTSTRPHTVISGDNLQVTGGFNPRMDTVDNENHPATFDESKLEFDPIPGRLFRDRRQAARWNDELGGALTPKESRKIYKKAKKNI
jgi:hypothetical protein